MRGIWGKASVMIAAVACFAWPAKAAQTLWTSYMRVGPGPQFAVLQELPSQVSLDVLDCRSGWCQVRFGTVVGYVRQSLVGDPNPPAAAGDKGCFDTVLTGHLGGDHVRICSR